MMLLFWILIYLVLVVGSWKVLCFYARPVYRPPVSPRIDYGLDWKDQD